MRFAVIISAVPPSASVTPTIPEGMSQRHVNASHIGQKLLKQMRRAVAETSNGKRERTFKLSILSHCLPEGSLEARLGVLCTLACALAPCNVSSRPWPSITPASPHHMLACSFLELRASIASNSCMARSAMPFWRMVVKRLYARIASIMVVSKIAVWFTGPHMMAYEVMDTF
jgi:hypothetical protein